MTRAKNVNVYQVATGVYAYSSSLAVDDDGSDPDPDPDHQGQTTFQDSNGKQLAAHHVPFYVLGDDCWDNKTPCPHFFYKEHNIKGPAVRPDVLQEQGHRRDLRRHADRQQPDHLGQRLPRIGRGVREGGRAARHPRAAAPPVASTTA